MGISRLDSLRLGSSKEDKFWGGGGENKLLSGERSGISRRQQSIKGGEEGLQKSDCQWGGIS